LILLSYVAEVDPAEYWFDDRSIVNHLLTHLLGNDSRLSTVVFHVARKILVDCVIGLSDHRVILVLSADDVVVVDHLDRVLLIELI